MILLRSLLTITNTSVIVFAMLMSIQACADPIQDAESKTTDKWAPFRSLLGHWKGSGHGPTGDSVQEAEWKLVLNDMFIQRKSSSRARGDDHQDIGLISYDESRKRYVYRAFHSEGFVNRYVAEISKDQSKIVFMSEAIENGPKGLKAMEIIELKDGRIETTFKLASGVGPFNICASGKLRRVESDRRD